MSPHTLAMSILVVWVALALGCATTEEHAPPPEEDNPWDLAQNAALFDKQGADKAALIALRDSDYIGSERHRRRIKAALGRASSGFRAASVEPLLRQALSQTDTSHAHALLTMACEVALGVGHPRLTDKMVLSVAFCSGQLPPGEVKTEFAVRAMRLLLRWQQSGALDEITGDLELLARDMARASHPRPRRMPYDLEAERSPMLIGLLLQVAQYQRLVYLGQRRPDAIDEIRQSYDNLYAELSP